MAVFLIDHTVLVPIQELDVTWLGVRLDHIAILVCVVLDLVLRVEDAEFLEVVG